ncbi:hypothetical protein AAC387_Pa05g1531 [Persea americana]
MVEEEEKLRGSGFADLIWSCQRRLAWTPHQWRRSLRRHCVLPEKERRFCLFVALQQETEDPNSCHQKQRDWFQICWRSVEEAGFVSDRRKNTRGSCSTLPLTAPWPERKRRCRRSHALPHCLASPVLLDRRRRRQ